ncbi:MAG TPA: hypothetical protein VF395_08845 [Polyangiaceae bacterium]
MNFDNRFAYRALTLGVGASLITCGLTACGLGDSKDVGGDTLQQGQVKGLDAGNAHGGGGGSTTTGAGGASTNPGPGGAGTAGGTAGTTGGGTAGATGGGTAGTTGGGSGGATGGGSGGATGGGIACGKNTCAKGEYCCNASCGMCAPMGAACIQIACDPAPVPCGTNTCASGEVCCNESCGICAAPGGGCTTQFCVPPTTGPCTTDADCTLYDHNCPESPCECLGVLKGKNGPACTGTGPTPQCLVASCQLKVAACVSGACVANPR